MPRSDRQADAGVPGAPRTLRPQAGYRRLHRTRRRNRGCVFGERRSAGRSLRSGQAGRHEGLCQTPPRHRGPRAAQVSSGRNRAGRFGAARNAGCRLSGPAGRGPACRPCPFRSRGFLTGSNVVSSRDALTTNERAEYPAMQRSRRAVQASKKWDTRAEKPNKRMARSSVPPTLNLLNYKTFCGPPLGTI